MTKAEHDDDRALEALFARARSHPPEMPEQLLARVLDDARHLQPTRASSLLGGWWRMLGGLPGLGGLVTATCVGFWLGVAPPDGMPDLADQILGQQVVMDETAPDLSGFGWDSEEG